MARWNTVRLNTKGSDKINQIMSEVRRRGAAPGNPMGAFVNSMGRRYIAFTVRRFKRNSRGGGEWPALSDSTVARRRSGKEKAKANPGEKPKKKKRNMSVREFKSKAKRIMTGKGSTAAREKKLRSLYKKRDSQVKRWEAKKASVKILEDTGGLLNTIQSMAGLQSFSLIPNGIRLEMKGRGRDGKMSYGEIARIHHFGLGHVPVRTIYVSPDATTLKGIVSDAKRAIAATNAQVNRAK